MTERDAHGRFTAGNGIAKGHNGKNAGRIPYAVRQDLAAMMEQRLPRATVIDRLAKRIEETGATEDIRLWLAYLVGLPVQKNENDGQSEVVLRVVYSEPGHHDPAT